MIDKFFRFSKRFWTFLIIGILIMGNGIKVINSTATETGLLLINFDSNESIAISDDEIIDRLHKSGYTVVFYGKSLDVETINQTYFPEDTLVLNPTKKQLESKPLQKDNISNQENKEQVDIKEESLCQTYAIVATNIADKINLSYYSFCYPAGMEIECIWNEVLSEENIKKIALKFSEEKRIEIQTRGTLVDDITDNTSYYDTYYPISMTSSFRMKMYEKNITYQAYKINDDIKEYDFYYVTAYVSITPGNNIIQDYPEYKNALVVIGSQTDITKGKSTDSFIEVAPNNSSAETLIQDKDYSYSLSIGLDRTVSIGFSWTPANKVTRTTSLTDNNFMNFYGGQDSKRHWCISTNTFTYKQGAYIRSYGSNFSCNVNTQVKTLFQNQALSDAKWSGNSMSLSYNAK